MEANAVMSRDVVRRPESEPILRHHYEVKKDEQCGFIRTRAESLICLREAGLLPATSSWSTDFANDGREISVDVTVFDTGKTYRCIAPALRGEVILDVYQL